jgi:dihydrofolate reductase
MKISLIVAMASNRAIGLNNQMPWHLSADLKKFKQITMGSPILMGRKTHESIGKALPGRTNIIISRNLSYKQDDCLVFDNIDKAIETVCKENDELFVMGGASIYDAMLAKADMLYLTKINKEFKGDTFFPVIDENDWKEISREDISTDQTFNFSYSFLKLEKLNKP